MHLYLEQLLLAAAPLFAATTKGKRKSVKKPIKRKVALPRAAKRKPATHTKKTTRKAVHPAARKPETRGKKAAANSRKVQSSKPALPVAKPDEIEPLPKPVAPSGRAILLSPENEKYADSEQPTFRWLSVGGATRYEIAWSEDAAMNSSHSIFSIATEATIPVEKPLHAGTTWHWRVRGGNESGWGPWSAISSFRVLEEPI